jgi:hypothetical protein
MSTQSNSRTPADSAREYIDDIAKINQKFGMGTVASEDVYNEAVTEAAAAFRWARSAQADPQPR